MATSFDKAVSGLVAPSKVQPRKVSTYNGSVSAVGQRKLEAKAKSDAAAKAKHGIVAPLRPQSDDAPKNAPNANASPSEDAIALAFVERHPDHRYVAPWSRWLRWDGKRWHEDSTGFIYERIRDLVRAQQAKS